eukprot:COSAG01_NODE_42644_length_438_cov_0.528024_2_plen_88_part_01
MLTGGQKRSSSLPSFGLGRMRSLSGSLLRSSDSEQPPVVDEDNEDSFDDDGRGVDLEVVDQEEVKGHVELCFNLTEPDELSVEKDNCS